MSFSGSLLGGGAYYGREYYSAGLIEPWTPEFLFARAEPGVWYDPSDLTTLFQDTAGTTPVTTAGQSVALMLDKSQGLTLGVNVIPSWASSGFWSIYNAGVVFNAGVMVFDELNDRCAAPTTLIAGRTYQLSIDATIESGGTVNFDDDGAGDGIGGVTVYAAVVSGGTTQAYFVATASTRFRFIQTSSTGTVVINSIAIRELPGNHATQAITASRPIYAVEPTTGRRNLLTYTEQFDNAAWSKITTTVGQNLTTAPDGTLTAEQITGTSANSLIYQVISGLTNDTNYTLSVYVKAVTSGISAQLAFYTNGGGTTIATQAFTTTGDWQRVSVSANSGTLIAQTWFAIGGGNTFGTGEDFYVWGAQLETGSTATAYQRVVSKYDVTEAGVPSRSYLSFDGIDDFMVTPTITPGADKAQVFAGVRKLSDASYPLVVEHSANANSNSGTFNIIASGAISGSAGWSYLSKGTASAQAQVGSGYASPITNVVTGLGNISGDTSLLRVNGAQVASSTADQGTGNYLAYPLYIGRRGGTTLPFNGNIYGLLVRFGANLSNSQVIAAERWLNNKTGAY